MYQDGERVYASATHDTMEAIRSFHAEDGAVEIPLDVRVRGNLLVVVHHVRAIPVAKKAGLVRMHACTCTCIVVCILYTCICNVI